ncbi:MAG: acyl-CoA dehydrogenase family protein [Actinobacteria bacterium]|nr:acyl-CoA dehydrogenase family protein [Actinomycetota bacterium]
MALQDTEADRAFRQEVRDWLAENLVGEFAELGSRGGPGREHEGFEVRQAWERKLGAAGLTCLGWPRAHGGREATLGQQVAFHEEYARAGAPARLGHIGEGLIGPTIIEFGTAAQKERFLPPIRSGDELWCQGYSEPDAGSDLANVKTRAGRDGDEWVITGQKVWTSLATWADWVFVLCRTDASAPKHKGLSYLLVPMDQPGIEVRPIVQLTGTSEFNEVFFDGARTPAGNIVGDVNDGWRVAMGTLAFERGVATLGQQVGFERELTNVIVSAQKNGANQDPVMRQRLAHSWIGLRLLRYNALRSLASIADGTPGPEASISKLHWASWHRALGELAVDVQGVHGLLAEGAPYDLTDEQRLFLFTRADTIYGGSNQIQRNIIGERALGLPRS